LPKNSAECVWERCYYNILSFLSRKALKWRYSMNMTRKTVKLVFVMTLLVPLLIASVVSAAGEKAITK
jgi:hypothetical protein